MMGDFGSVTRKDKLPITVLYATMPLHKVTLDNYSRMPIKPLLMTSIAYAIYI